MCLCVCVCVCVCKRVRIWRSADRMECIVRNVMTVIKFANLSTICYQIVCWRHMASLLVFHVLENQDGRQFNRFYTYSHENRTKFHDKPSACPVAVKTGQIRSLYSFETLKGDNIKPLNTKRKLLVLKTQFVPGSKHFFNSVIKTNQFMLLSGTSRCLFSDKYKTHKHSAGRTYSC